MIDIYDTLHAIPLPEPHTLDLQGIGHSLEGVGQHFDHAKNFWGNKLHEGIDLATKYAQLAKAKMPTVLPNTPNWRGYIQQPNLLPTNIPGHTAIQDITESVDRVGNDTASKLTDVGEQIKEKAISQINKTPRYGISAPGVAGIAGVLGASAYASANRANRVTGLLSTVVNKLEKTQNLNDNLIAGGVAAGGLLAGNAIGNNMRQTNQTNQAQYGYNGTYAYMATFGYMPVMPKMLGKVKSNLAKSGNLASPNSKLRKRASEALSNVQQASRTNNVRPTNY